MTLVEIQTNLAEWKAAYSAVAKGQVFSMNGRTLTRVDADTIRNQIVWLERQEKQKQNEAAGRGPLGASVARFTVNT